MYSTGLRRIGPLKLFLEALHHAIHNASPEIGGNKSGFEFLQEGRIRRTAKQPIQRPTNDIARFGEPGTQSLQPSHRSTREAWRVIQPSTGLVLMSRSNRDEWDSLASAAARATAKSSVHDEASGGLLSHFVHDHSHRDAERRGPRVPSALPPAIVGPVWLDERPSAPQSPR